VKKDRILLLLGGLGLGLIIGGGILWSNQIFASASQAADQQPVIVGSPIPDIELPNLDGEVVRISGFKGKPLIINFWATWCAPCKLEMPLLQQTAQKFDGKLSIAAINFQESEKVVADFANKNQIELIILLDEKGEIAQKFRVHAFPITFFIDESGIVRAIHLGQLNKDLVEENLLLLGLKE